MALPPHLQTLMNQTGHIGWIPPHLRTQAQHTAHLNSIARHVAFGLAPPKATGPVKVVLTDLWSDPLVVADLGFAFTGYYQFTGSCQKGTAPVRMANGSEKCIQDVKIGDEVITHTGNARKVLRLFNRKFTGKMVTLNLSGHPFPLEVTEDHRVAVMRLGVLNWIRSDHVEVGDDLIVSWDRREPIGQTLDVAELLGERAVVLDELMKDDAFTKGQEPDVPMSNVCMARHVLKKSGIDWHGKVKLARSRSEKALFRHVPVSTSLARFVGLYLAEGGCETEKESGKVTFTFAGDEENLCGDVLSLARGLFGAEGKTFISNERGTARKVVFGNSSLAAMLKALIPGNVYTKRVPGIFFRADKETKLALLLGWLHGDGHAKLRRDKQGRPVLTISGASTCKGLARDMTMLAISCGIKASCWLMKARKRTKEFCSVALKGRTALSLFPELAAQVATAGITPGKDDSHNRCPFGYIRKVKRIDLESVVELPVFDIEVEEDHSYLSNDVCASNCVGVSTGNAVNTLSFVQRKLTTNPTKALLSFWPFDYGQCRKNEGDSGEGEGAVDSVMGQTISGNGVLTADQQGLPTFNQTPDGFQLSQSLEMTWSNGAASVAQPYLSVAKQYPVGGIATLNNVADIKAAILNGYPVLDGCDNYVGNGSIQGSGADAAVVGQYDGAGGHSTCILGYWDNATLGPLYLYSNQWQTSTYPVDPAGAGRCCVWIKESTMAKLFQTGGSGGETMALSHLTYFPSQPEILSWFDAA